MGVTCAMDDWGMNKYSSCRQSTKARQSGGACGKKYSQAMNCGYTTNRATAEGILMPQIN